MEKEKKKWQLVKTAPAIDLGILNIHYHYYKNPRNGKTVQTIAMTNNDAVNVIALTKDKQVILVKQFRFGIGAYTLELPGGMVDDGEQVLIAAQRELREETGFAGTNWNYLGKIQSNPVFMDGLVHHYIVDNASKQFELSLDEAEDVELVKMSIAEAYELIDTGIIQHPHTISAFFFARQLFKE